MSDESDVVRVTGPPYLRPDGPPPHRPPNQMRPNHTRLGKAINMKTLDTSLEASHERMTRAVAVQSRRIEINAEQGGLTTEDIETLARLSTTWKTLVANEPVPDWTGVSEDEIRSRLAALKARK